ncbi:MAG: cytochrome c [Acidobacteriota bacterium]|nr:cytochrome c [Acidobacteriota bacterium]
MLAGTPRGKTLAAVLATTLAAAALAGCNSTPPPTPLSQLNDQQMRGHAVFQARCGVCHYDRQRGDLHGPSLLGVFKKQALPSGAAATDERVMATIQHGRNMMPPVGSSMDPQDVADVLAYLHTL